MNSKAYIGSILLSLLVSTLSLAGYTSGSSQPLKNGGFEQGVEYWLRSGVEASISDAHVHSGRYALRTSGGSIWQTVDVEPPLNPLLRFWIYLSTVYGNERGKTDAAITITVISPSFERNISYYVSGPNRQDNETKIVLTSELQRDQWIFIERNLRNDFTKYYKTIKFDEVQKIRVKIWSMPTSDPIPFWDDISLEYLAAPTTPTATPTPTKTPTPTTPTPPTTTPPPTILPLPPEAKGRILFHSNRDGNFELYALNLDNSELLRLTNNPADDLYGAWSPDGSKIAFKSTRDDPKGDIYTMNADGTGLTRLTRDPGNDGYPSWSPDGKKIAFESNRTGNFQIYIMNADGSEVKRLMANSAVEGVPKWSPDGKKIVFHSNRDGNFEIYTINADTSDLKRLTNNKVHDRFPSWSPDGKFIVFQTNLDNNEELCMMSVDGSKTYRITEMGSNEGYPAWQPTQPTTTSTLTGIWGETPMTLIFTAVLLGILAGVLIAFRRKRRKIKEKPAVQAAQVTYCLNCGEPLKPDSRYCTKCGSAVSG